METFNTITDNAQLFTKVKVNTTKKAFTKIHYLVNDIRIKPHLAVSEIYDNGSIDLDQSGKVQWTYLDTIGKLKNNTLEYISIVENLPKDCNTNDKVKKFILENVKIDYTLQENSNEDTYVLNENDRVELLIERTAVIYKYIKVI